MNTSFLETLNVEEAKAILKETYEILDGKRWQINYKMLMIED